MPPATGPASTGKRAAREEAVGRSAPYDGDCRLACPRPRTSAACPYGMRDDARVQGHARCWDVAAASKVAPSHPAALMRASLVAPLGRPMREPLRPVGPASSPSSDRMASCVEGGGSDVPLFFRELLDLSSLVRFKRCAFRLRAPKVKRPASPR